MHLASLALLLVVLAMPMAAQRAVTLRLGRAPDGRGGVHSAVGRDGRIVAIREAGP